MEEIELKFTTKRRQDISPLCPCGEKNSPNPFFNPYDGFDGQYGHCHKCDKDFFPFTNYDNPVKYIAPAKKPQKFITPEPIFNWVLQDTIIDPVPPKGLLNGQYSITWYFRNAKGKLCTSKKMVYEFPQFKRVKDIHPIYQHTRDSGYYPCLFYERDLTTYPSATVILVESEKTAAILRRKFEANLSEFIYLAVGGANGLTDDKLHALQDRIIWIIYDCDNGDKQDDGTTKSPKGREAAQSALLRLSAIAIPKVIDLFPDRNDGTDLADIRETLTLQDLRNFGLTGKNDIPDGIVLDLKTSNRAGEYLNDEGIKKLADKFYLSPDKIRIISDTIHKNFAHEFGVANGPLIQQLECWLLDRYEFRRNVLTSRVFCRKRNGIWDECNENNIWRDVHHNIKDFIKTKKIPKADIENILYSEFVPDFNPIKEYFESLPAWDGNDHITNLANHIICEDQPFWTSQFKKALVRMIACSYGHIENRIIMTFVQEEQESGKSSFIRFLCPPELQSQGYFKEEALIHTKDTDIALAENFMWNLEELADLNRKEIAELKAIISKKSVKQRRAYARHEQSMLRIVNFWGSTNKTEFLADTQNTRWLCFNVVTVNHDYNHWYTKKQNVDITKVWAQAWHLYNSAFEYTLTKDERAYRDIVNQGFESMSDEKQLIMRLFAQCKKSDPTAEFMVNVDILEYLINNTTQRMRIDSRNIGRAMKQLGFLPDIKKVEGKTYRGYWITKRSGQPPVITDTPQVELFADKDEEFDLPY